MYEGNINTQIENEIAKFELPDVSGFDPNAKTMYPITAEREYVRLMRGEMKQFKEVLLEYLPRIIEEYKKASDTGYREDDIFDFSQKMQKMFGTIYRKMLGKLGRRRFIKQLEKVAAISGKRAINEWRKLVKKSIGIDLTSDAFMGETYQKQLKDWTKNNVNLIVTVPRDTLGQLEAVVLDGYKNGLTVAELRDVILSEYNVSEKRAEFWARDQVSKLNAEITQEQHKAAGVTKYRWCSSHDERVRECHAFYDGKIFSYNNPPEQWYVTKSRGIVHTGKYANPGEFYNCRCIAYPVFDDDRYDRLLNQDSRFDSHDSLDDYDDIYADSDEYKWESVNLDDKWITINGTHVEIDGNGRIKKGPDGLKRRKGSWQDGFPKVLIHTITSKMKKNENYAAAKRGDYESAKRLVRDLCKEDRLKTLAESYPDAIVVPVVSKDKGTNQIPKAYADLLGEQGLCVSDDVKIVKKGNHTGKSEFERLISENKYSGKVEPGKNYIIVDDVVTNGGTVNSLRRYIEKHGGKVVAVSTLTSGKGSTQISPTKESLDKVYAKHGSKRINAFLKAIGIGDNIESMTNREVNYIRNMNSKTLDTIIKENSDK